MLMFFKTPNSEMVEVAMAKNYPEGSFATVVFLIALSLGGLIYLRYSMNQESSPAPIQQTVQYQHQAPRLEVVGWSFGVDGKVFDQPVPMYAVYIGNVPQDFWTRKDVTIFWPSEGSLELWEKNGASDSREKATAVARKDLPYPLAQMKTEELAAIQSAWFVGNDLFRITLKDNLSAKTLYSLSSVMWILYSDFYSYFP